MGEVVSLEPDWIVGPFEVNHVVIHGRIIPDMTARRVTGGTAICVDNRFEIVVPNELAYQVAWFAATAMAIGAGYASVDGTTRGRPFARRGAPLGELPPKPTKE